MIMKHLLCGLMLFAGFAETLYAVPVAFERNYVNQAWGYANHGCFIDESRFVYTYDVQKGIPFQNVGRVAEDEFAKAISLIEKSVKATFSERFAMADAGIESWVGYSDGVPIRLKQTGDYTGTSSAPEAEEVVALINTWCPKE